MKTFTTAKIILATAVLASGVAAFAQTSTMPGNTNSATSTTGTSQAPTTVGVTPQTAAEANRQAVPRSDTGTVVRTSPNAADTARSATGMTGSTDATAGSTSGSTGSGTTMRAARADRN